MAKRRHEHLSARGHSSWTSLRACSECGCGCPRGSLSCFPHAHHPATSRTKMAARNVGFSTPRLQTGDTVSTESSRFDAPGQPGSYSAGKPARAIGVVLGRSRTEGCFTVKWRGGTSMESTWKHLRLEPEDDSTPKQREGEAAPAFRRRVERCVAEADRKAKAAERQAERRRRKRHEQRVRRHDAAVPPERREGETNRRLQGTRAALQKPSAPSASKGALSPPPPRCRCRWGSAQCSPSHSAAAVP